MSFKNFTPAINLLAAARAVLALHDNPSECFTLPENEEAALRAAITAADAMSVYDDEGAAAISAARDRWASDDLEIDDEPNISPSDDGTWVSSWVWVDRYEYALNDEDEAEEAA